MPGGGGIIIIQDSINTLNKPEVHGNLPPRLQALIDPLLSKDPSTWTPVDKIIVSHVYTWALCNLV